MDKVVNKRYLKVFKEFKCIGGACEDSCCIGWDIDIDKETFLKYEKVNSSLGKYLIENIDLNKNKEEFNYGNVKLRKDKRCPFLNEENYCLIHSNLGEGYLSNICSQFPRVINKIDNVLEFSLDVSCIEAARKVLLAKDLEVFEEEDIDEKKIVNNTLDTREDGWLPNKYFKEIREESFKIIKNKKYTINERLYILGKFINDVEEEFTYNYDNLDIFIKNYTYENILLKDSNEVFNIEMFKELIGLINVEKESFKDLTKRVLNNYDKVEDKSYFEIFEREVINKGKVFENYLINYMFSSLFPFSEIESLFDSYLMFILRFEFIKFYVRGIYIEDNSINNEKVILVIQKFSKEMGHHKDYNEKVLEYLKEREFYNIEDLYGKEEEDYANI